MKSASLVLLTVFAICVGFLTTAGITPLHIVGLVIIVSALIASGIALAMKRRQWL